MRRNPLKGKKILITAGPTWVPVDDVRVLSNVSSGELGMLLARRAKMLDMKVDLFLGPVGCVDPGRGITVSRFRFFNDLFELVKTRLKRNRYDFILHAAAVSDYLCYAVAGKISSSNSGLVLKLRRAPKIIEWIKRLNPKSFLVMFKLESNVSDSVLLKRSLEAMKRSKADLVVANTFQGGHYKGFILGAQDISVRARSKKELTRELFKILIQ
jgi:phosphopantothenoylcysteine decarboxylase/phosphopantothenate--cysteine ligase